MRPIPDRRFLNQDRSETRMHTIPLPLLLGIDWVMKETALGDKSGIKWTFTETLGDLDFADDISLLSHRYSDIQRKSDELARNAGKNWATDKHKQNKYAAKQQPNSRPHHDWRKGY